MNVQSFIFATKVEMIDCWQFRNRTNFVRSSELWLSIHTSKSTMYSGASRSNSNLLNDLTNTISHLNPFVSFSNIKSVNAPFTLLYYRNYSTQGSGLDTNTALSCTSYCITSSLGHSSLCSNSRNMWPYFGKGTLWAKTLFLVMTKNVVNGNFYGKWLKSIFTNNQFLPNFCDSLMLVCALPSPQVAFTFSHYFS